METTPSYESLPNGAKRVYSSFVKQIASTDPWPLTVAVDVGFPSVITRVSWMVLPVPWFAFGWSFNPPTFRRDFRVSLRKNGIEEALNIAGPIDQLENVWVRVKSQDAVSLLVSMTSSTQVANWQSELSSSPAGVQGAIIVEWWAYRLQNDEEVQGV